MSKKIQFFPVLFMIFTLLFFFFNICQVYCDESDAASRVLQAEDSLEAAYLSVLMAEAAGGDVSDFVAVLNSGLEYYSEAERALDTGEYEVAVLMAGKAVEASNVVLDADISLMVVAESVERATYRNQLFLSFGAVFFIALSGFFSWRLIKQYYTRRVMESRLEVVNESR